VRGVERRFVEGSLWLPAGDLSDAALDAHLARLARFRPDVLQGYPGATDALARRAGNAPPLRVPIVVLTAEPVLPAQRERIAAAFGAEVFTFYGAREVGWIASECAGRRRLHVNTAGVHLEAAPDGGLLVTDLENLAMPLVRYAIGDRGALDPAPCPCGDPRPVLDRLEGRECDVFTLPSGRRVPGLLLDVRGLQWEAPGVLEAQVVQTAPAALLVRWVRAANFAEGDLETFRGYLDDVLRGEMAIAFEETDRIAPGPNGKVRHTLALPAASP
jgi:phenylacetate-CoA ligase